MASRNNIRRASDKLNYWDFAFNISSDEQSTYSEPERGSTIGDPVNSVNEEENCDLVNNLHQEESGDLVNNLHEEENGDPVNLHEDAEFENSLLQVDI